MLIAVISDTHDDAAITEWAVDLAVQRGAEALIHCGDLASPEIIRVCSRLPTHFVFGNHDADVVPELQKAAQQYQANCLGWGGMIELGGSKIGVTHGHMTSDLRPLLAEKPDYLLTGHTHEAADWQQEQTHRVCPGALFRADPPTFALLDLVKGRVEFVSLSASPSASPQ